MIFLSIFRAAFLLKPGKGSTRHFYSRDTSPGVYSYPVPEEARVSKSFSLLAEDKADGGAQRVLLSGWGQKSRPRVAGKDDDIGGVLVGNQQPLITGIEGEMARASCLRSPHAARFERSLTIVDGENRHAVIPAVGGIEEPAGGIDRHRGRGIRSGKAFGEGGDVLDPVQRPSLPIPCQGIECAGYFVEGIRPLVRWDEK